MAAPRSERFAPHYKSQTTQRTWRWLIRNKATPILLLKTQSNEARRVDRIDQNHSTCTSLHRTLPVGSQARYANARCTFRTLHRNSVRAWQHGSNFFVHHMDTTIKDKNCVVWRRFLVTHIEPSWYQRSLPINHYYHRRLIGLALCYCRFVHLYCYIRTACRGPLKYAFST